MQRRVIKAVPCLPDHQQRSHCQAKSTLITTLIFIFLISDLPRKRNGCVRTNYISTKSTVTCWLMPARMRTESAMDAKKQSRSTPAGSPAKEPLPVNRDSGAPVIDFDVIPFNENQITQHSNFSSQWEVSGEKNMNKYMNDLTEIRSMIQKESKLIVESLRRK